MLWLGLTVLHHGLHSFTKALTLLKALFFFSKIVTSPSRFAVPYTLGNILGLCSFVYNFSKLLTMNTKRTGFLIGPMRQLKMMVKPTRLAATAIFFGGLILTLIAVFAVIDRASLFKLNILKLKDKGTLLVLLGVLIQFGALVWYCLSYIPYARTCVKNCCSSIVAV